MTSLNDALPAGSAGSATNKNTSSEKIIPRGLPDGEIDKFIRDHVCARCYSDLSKVPAAERTWQAVCQTCGDAWHGATIRRRTAERRAQQGLAELSEVKHNLRDLFPNPHKGKTFEQLITELGF